jgi:hypothetical protein
MANVLILLAFQVRYFPSLQVTLQIFPASALAAARAVPMSRGINARRHMAGARSIYAVHI